MKTIRPLQISANHQVVDRDGQFHLVTSGVMGFRLDSAETILEMEFYKDAFENMGYNVSPDTGMPKPQAEFLAWGAFHSPNGEQVEGGNVKIKIGHLEKELYVLGDRIWQNGVPSQPEKIMQLPLEYSLAFGGAEYELNPKGMGFQEDRLPNIETPGSLVTSNSASGLHPAGFGPLNQTLPQRRQYQGTYGDDYLEKYFPGYPPDFDWRFFMTAPKDQWSDSFFTGEEAFEIHNMHPEKSVIKGKLPGLRMRGFINVKKVNDDPDFIEIPLNLDTIWFFPAINLGLIIYRGGIDVADDEADNIAHLLIAYERQTEEKRPLSHYQHALHRRLEADDYFLNNFNTADLIATGDKTAMKILQEMALEGVEPGPFEKNLDAKAQAVREMVTKKMEELQSEIEKGIPETKDEKSAEQVSKLKSMLGNISEKREPDNDVRELHQRLDEILPGISSGEPKKIDLSEFTFDKIGKLVDEVEKVANEKKDFALSEVKKAQGKLDELVKEEQKKITGSASDKENTEINNSLSMLNNLREQPSEQQDKSTLPRLNIRAITNAMSELDKEVKESMQDLQRASIPATTMSELDQLMHDNILMRDQPLKEKLLQCEKDFRSGYILVAHFQNNGLSPHKEELNDLKQELLSAIKHQTPVLESDWSCLDLSGHSFGSVDFSGCYLEQVDLSNTRIENVDFSGAILSRANLSGAEFTNCKFFDANVGAVNANKACFTDCDFTNAKISRGDFTGSHFTSCNLADIESLEITINDCVFDSSTMENLKLIEAEVINAKFIKSKLSGTSVVCSALKNCDFEQSDLTRATIVDSVIEETGFNHALMVSTCFAVSEPEKGKLTNVSFSHANLEKANFQGMIIENADFTHATLVNANCNEAHIRHGNFTEANLRQCQFRKTDLTHAKFDNADIMEGSFAKAILVGASMNNTNLYGVDFLQSTFGDTDFSNANLDATLIKDWRPS